MFLHGRSRRPKSGLFQPSPDDLRTPERKTSRFALVPGRGDGSAAWARGLFALPSTREGFWGLHPGPAFS